MKKNKLLIRAAAAFLLATGICGCASNRVNGAIPLWTSYDTIEQAYPNSDFIARIGYSPNKLEAAALAESELGSYFSHSVHSIVQGTQTITDSGAANANVSRKIDYDVTVESLLNLFDVRKTPAWYDSSKRQYVCCAYINRADAWKIYEQTARDARDNFRSFYDNAQKQKEPINRIKLLKAAQTAGDAFKEKLNFANMLSENLTKKTFGMDEQLLSVLPSMIKKEQDSNSVFVKVNDDNAGVIESAIKNSLANLGFVVTGKQKDASYVAKAEVNFNKASGTKMIVLNPFANVSLEGKNGGAYAVVIKTERVVAPNEQAAKRLAAQDLADEINAKLEADIKSKLGL